MTLRQLSAYMLLCEINGWDPSFEGARAFKKQIKQGLRDPETFEWREKND